MHEVVAEERGAHHVEKEQKESSGESTLNKIAIMPQAVDKERVSDRLLQEKSSGKSVLDETAIMSGCGNAFNLMEKCVVAGCESCIKNVDNNNHRVQRFANAGGVELQCRHKSCQIKSRKIGV